MIQIDCPARLNQDKSKGEERKDALKTSETSELGRWLPSWIRFRAVGYTPRKNIGEIGEDSDDL
jgi:hypothetical protein